MDGLYYIGCDMLLICFRVETFNHRTCCISMRIVYQHPLLGDKVKFYDECRYIFENERLEIRIHNVPELCVKDDDESFIVYLRGNNYSHDYRWSAIEIPTYRRDYIVRDIISNLVEFFTDVSGHHFHAVMEIPFET